MGWKPPVRLLGLCPALKLCTAGKAATQEPTRLPEHKEIKDNEPL